MKPHVFFLPLLLLPLSGGLLAQGQSLSDYAKAHPLVAEKTKGSLTVAGSSAPAPNATPELKVSRQNPADPCRVETVAEASRLGDALKLSPSAKVTEPFPKYQSKPKYPESLRRRHIQGQVVATGLVSCDGTLKDVTIQKSSHPELEPLAIDALSEWRYKPALVNGQPRPAVLTVVVTFTLGKPPA